MGATVAALLEASQHVVVVLNQLQPDRVAQFFRLVISEPMAPGDAAHDLINKTKVVEKEPLVIACGPQARALFGATAEKARPISAQKSTSGP